MSTGVDGAGKKFALYQNRDIAGNCNFACGKDGAHFVYRIAAGYKATKARIYNRSSSG